MSERFPPESAPLPSAIDVPLRLETSGFRAALLDADRMAKAFSRSLSDAFVGVALKGKSLSDVVSEIGLRLSRVALDSALKPLEQGLAQALRPLGQGVQAALSSGAREANGPPLPLLPFARGGVIAAPTYFPLGDRTGLAGERGAEAILPLARAADGSLGVRASGGAASAPVSVTVNIATPDIASFRRAEAEVAAGLARAVARGRRAS